MHRGDTLVVIVDYRLLHDAMRCVGSHDVFFVSNWIAAPHSVESTVLMRDYVKSVRVELMAMVQQHRCPAHKRTLMSAHIAELDLRSRLIVQEALRESMPDIEIGCHSSLDATNDFVRLICGNRYFPTAITWASNDFRALLTQAPAEDIEALSCLTRRRARGDEKSFFDHLNELTRQISHEDSINRDDVGQVLEGLCLVIPEASSIVTPVKEEIASAEDAVSIRTATADLISIIAPTLWHNR